MCVLFYLFTLVSLVFINKEYAAISFDSSMKSGFIYFQLSVCVCVCVCEELLACYALLLRSVCCFVFISLGLSHLTLSAMEMHIYVFDISWFNGRKCEFESALAKEDEEEEKKKCKNT